MNTGTAWRRPYSIRIWLLTSWYSKMCSWRPPMTISTLCSKMFCIRWCCAFRVTLKSIKWFTMQRWVPAVTQQSSSNYRRASPMESQTNNMMDRRPEWFRSMAFACMRPRFVTFSIHRSNCILRFEHFTFDIAIDWRPSIRIHRASSVCACSTKNCCKRTSLSCGAIFVNCKFNRNNVAYFIFKLTILLYLSIRIRIVFKWLMRAFSGHLPPDELLVLWDLVSLFSLWIEVNK